MPEEHSPEANKVFIKNNLNVVKKEFDRLKKDSPYKNYKITEYIDEGSFAMVYRVESKLSAPLYAIRICVDDTGKSAREFNAVRQLMLQGQRHIVEYLMVFTVKTEGHTLRCTLMNYLSPLSKYSESSDDIEIAVRCGNDILPVLQICMQKQILHRDIKSKNIFFDTNFRNNTGLLLGDFGEARRDRAGTVTRIGTLSTISPEIFGFDEKVRSDHRLSDMYSLGIVMYYYLNGRAYPFCDTKKIRDNNDAYMRRLNTKGMLPAPRYGSERLKNLVLKATQYYPENRFASPQEMLDELKLCDEYKQYIHSPDISDEVTIAPVKIRKRLKPGETIPFGKFPQTSNGVVRPLFWRVLDVTDGKALLVTEKLIICKEYHENPENGVTWESCSLRQWLNQQFLLKAFGSFRPEQILLQTNANRGNPHFKTKGGSSTNDMVFLLSVEEMKKYFGSDHERIAPTTDYFNRLYDNKEQSQWWWLRTPGDYGNYAACVNNAGCIRELGRKVNDKTIAVRPALWIKI